MKISLLILVIVIWMGACRHEVSNTNVSDESRFKVLLRDIDQILDQKETLLKDILRLPIIFNKEYVNGFPENRSFLKQLAEKQIDLFNKMNELDNAQIEKLEQISRLRIEKDLLRIANLQKQIQEKRIEDVNLGIEKCQLTFDEKIQTSQELEERVLQISQKQALIRKEEEELERQRKALQESE